MNLNSILQRLRSVLASPIEELSKCEKIIWYLWRLVQGGAKKLAEEAGIAENGYRLLINCGDHGHQEVFHLHMHLVGGKPLGRMLPR